MMAPSDFAEMGGVILLVGVIWLAGAFYIKLADFYLQMGKRARASTWPTSPRRTDRRP